MLISENEILYVVIKTIDNSGLTFSPMICLILILEKVLCKQ